MDKQKIDRIIQLMEHRQHISDLEINSNLECPRQPLKRADVAAQEEIDKLLRTLDFDEIEALHSRVYPVLSECFCHEEAIPEDTNGN